MSDTQVELIVAAFSTEQGADTALSTLAESSREHLGNIKDAAVVRRDEHGRLHIDERDDIGVGFGAGTGAALGAAIGIFGGPIGVLIGGATGALIGGLGGALIDSGIPDDQLKQIGNALTPSSSALVALVEHDTADYLRSAFQQAGATTLAQGIPSQIAAQLSSGRNVAATAMAEGGDLVATRASAASTVVGTPADGTNDAAR
ncbi:MAG: DUF1269 domain-containing protein [Roseiflexaceae bacterium]|nr:DUF1269 domain-containing protein [Roseiflexaceae bacterium]